MEVKWTKWLEENSAEHYGTEYPTGGGSMEYVIGYMKEGGVFFGVFYDCDAFPNDPFGDVYWFENANTMRINLLHMANDTDCEDWTPEIASELISAFGALGED